MTGGSICFRVHTVALPKSFQIKPLFRGGNSMERSTDLFSNILLQRVFCIVMQLTDRSYSELFYITDAFTQLICSFCLPSSTTSAHELKDTKSITWRCCWESCSPQSYGSLWSQHFQAVTLLHSIAFYLDSIRHQVFLCCHCC